MPTAHEPRPLFDALRSGAPLPDFAIPDLNGRNVIFDHLLADTKPVLFLFVGAHCAPCEALLPEINEWESELSEKLKFVFISQGDVAVNKEKFDAAGASIIGVSRDSIARLNAFSADPEYCAGKIAVASDGDGKIATSYGLTKMDIKPGMKDTRGVEIDHEFTERTTFVVTSDGKIAATFSTTDDKISPADHVQKSLVAVQQLKGAKSSAQ